MLRKYRTLLSWSGSLKTSHRNSLLPDDVVNGLSHVLIFPQLARTTVTCPTLLLRLMGRACCCPSLSTRLSAGLAYALRSFMTFSGGVVSLSQSTTTCAGEVRT
jgi:hypothetical protein